MKKVFVVLFVSLLLAGCNEIRHHDLFEKTDYFVESLYSDYETYGMLGGEQYTKYAENDTYKITPIGRLINVRIEHYASQEEYDKLCKILERHYSGDSRVNSVYICQGGTIMIDCRN
jgi:hypothetical protein